MSIAKSSTPKAGRIRGRNSDANLSDVMSVTPVYSSQKTQKCVDPETKNAPLPKTTVKYENAKHEQRERLNRNNKIKRNEEWSKFLKRNEKLQSNNSIMQECKNQISFYNKMFDTSQYMADLNSKIAHVDKLLASSPELRTKQHRKKNIPSNTSKVRSVSNSFTFNPKKIDSIDSMLGFINRTTPSEKEYSKNFPSRKTTYKSNDEVKLEKAKSNLEKSMNRSRELLAKSKAEKKHVSVPNKNSVGEMNNLDWISPENLTKLNKNFVHKLNSFKISESGVEEGTVRRKGTEMLFTNKTFSENTDEELLEANKILNKSPRNDLSDIDKIIEKYQIRTESNSNKKQSQNVSTETDAQDKVSDWKRYFTNSDYLKKEFLASPNSMYFSKMKNKSILESRYKDHPNDLEFSMQ